MEDQIKSYVSLFTGKIPDLEPAFAHVYEQFLRLDLNTEKGMTASKHPCYAAGVAEATKYFIQSKVTQQEIANAMGCSTDSVRKQRREFVERNDEDLDIARKYGIIALTPEGRKILEKVKATN